MLGLPLLQLIVVGLCDMGMACVWERPMFGLVENEGALRVYGPEYEFGLCVSKGCGKRECDPSLKFSFATSSSTAGTARTQRQAKATITLRRTITAAFYFAKSRQDRGLACLTPYGTADKGRTKRVFSLVSLYLQQKSRKGFENCRIKYD